MFKIEKRRHKPTGVKGIAKYPFAKMEVGDSFFVPTENPTATQNSLRSSARKYRREGKVFSMPADTYKGVRGVSVWRDR